MADNLMQRRTLGSTGIEVSVLGLGTVKFGRNEKVKYPTAFDIPDETQLDALVATAEELGINLIDTAPSYGIAEERLGRLLKNRRQRWVIAGKAGEEFIDGQSRYDFRPAAIMASVENSLQRLQTDYIDILLLHATEGDIALMQDDALLETLQNLKLSGKVRAIGLSSHSIEAGMAAAEMLDVIMVGYNSGWRAEEPVIAKAAQNKVGIIIKKALNSGHAVDAAEALKFCLSNPGVGSAIVGTINDAHLRANVAAVQSI